MPPCAPRAQHCLTKPNPPTGAGVSVSHVWVPEMGSGHGHWCPDVQVSCHQPLCHSGVPAPPLPVRLLKQPALHLQNIVNQEPQFKAFDWHIQLSGSKHAVKPLCWGHLPNECKVGAINQGRQPGWHRLCKCKLNEQ